MHPADSTEELHLKRMQGLLARATDPFSRQNFEPGHFTASAFVLAPQRDALLLILHRKLGLWLQPGGHIEATDRDLIAAARREVAEEVGLPELELLSGGIFDVDVHRIPGRKNEPEHEHFDIRFLFRASTRDFVAGHEIAGAKWVPVTEIGEAHSDPSVLRATKKIERIYRGTA
jgi:8-oxo-dGTP pyrophosphatase MutT (NUDIX family)